MFRSLAVLIPLFIATVLRNPLEHDNVFSGRGIHSRVLLVTAHPDDESLFFAPTVISLLSHKQHISNLENVAQGAEVYFLCLSAGDADGLGQIRKQELVHSLDVFGIDEDKRWIVDNPYVKSPCNLLNTYINHIFAGRNLKDNITITWDPQVIADVVKPYIVSHEINVVSSIPVTWCLDAYHDIHPQILTFDHQGISSHPNHKAIPLGLEHLLSSRLSHPIPKLYTLISLPLFAKFQGPLAPILAKYDLFLQRIWQSIHAYFFGTPSEVGPDDRLVLPVFVSGVQEYLTALKSMRQHRSQLVWFRYLYVVASRYMWVNEWLEVKVPNATNSA